MTPRRAKRGHGPPGKNLAFPFWGYKNITSIAVMSLWPFQKSLAPLRPPVRFFSGDFVAQED